MMPASKHGDPQLGVDIHLCVVPPSPSPVPLPTPHISIVFDPFDYVPYIGATVTVCGMKRATAGTNGMVVHIPPGFPFAPKLPDKDDELFMGSSTVVADGDPFSFTAVPVLGCQVAGMLSIPRLKKKGSGKKAMLAPTICNLAIPSSVVVGGPPTISLMALAMKGAFAALGKFAKSGLFKRIRQKVFKNLNPGFLKCTILRAEPVNILTGDVSVEQDDFTLPGRIPIEWSRSYSSGNRREGLCGYGWETPADARLEVDPSDGSVSMRHPTVGPLFFARLPVAPGDDAGEVELMDGARLADRGSDYTVRTKQDRIYHFSKALARISGEGSVEYPLVRISDLCGNWLEFERQAGRAMVIQESAGRRIDIEIDGGRITQVALHVPSTGERHTFVRYEYDAGDLSAAIDAPGHSYRFAYDEHHLVRHTDRNGLSFYYEYAKGADGWRAVHTWGDGGLYDYRFDYIDGLSERRITDSLGNVSLVKLDERGLPICEIDALGGMTVHEYDDAGRPTAVVDQDGHRTEYEYDDSGNLRTLTRPDGTCIATEFSDTAKPLAIVDPNGGRWEQRWDDRGLLVEQQTPLGHRSRYEYDHRGQLVGFINPRGARTAFGFDALGNLVSMTDALQHATVFSPDLLGNVTAKVDSLGQVTRYVYDVKGRLTGVRAPSGSVTRCAYDPESNLVFYVDENGAVTRLEYFGLGELAKRIQADGHVVQYHYDTEESLTGVTNQRGETYHLVRDGLGRIVEEVDYWGQSRRYRYSAGGYINESVDPLGRVIRYQTDALGRILKRSIPKQDAGGRGFEETFQYDAAGNLITAKNPHRVIERAYDPDGRLVQEAQGDGFTIRNSYDGVGNRIRRDTELSVPGETVCHSAEYAYDLLDRAVALAIDDHTPISIERDAAGRIVAERLSSTLQRQRTYHPDGHLTRQTVRQGADVVVDVSYAYDAVGNLTERRDTRYGIDKLIYDPVGHITEHIDPEGRLSRFFNDPAGDRLVTRRVERQPGVARAASSSRFSTIDRMGVSTAQSTWCREGEYQGARYRFDAAGNLVGRTDSSGDLMLTWDADQRLEESYYRGLTTSYGYDALGRRTEKRTGSSVTTFWWDGNALVAHVTRRATGAREAQTTYASRPREYFYYPASFVPLACVDAKVPRQRLLHYHVDPNGGPAYLTDTKGEVQWSARYSPCGATSAPYVNLVDNRLRLQGQYEDEETGLCYNRCRYYEPVIGQFASRDPIGLSGGTNLHGYAPNVIGWTDPLGLKCEKFVRYLTEAEAKAMKEANGLVPKMHGDTPSRGAKWISELGKARDPGGLGKKAQYTHMVEIEVEVGTKAWLNDASRKMDYERMVGGEADNASKVFTKANEPGSYGVGSELLNEFNKKVKGINITKL